MKTIIVATDFSPEAENALDYAAAAAKQSGARLILFHLHIVSIHAVNARVSPTGIQELIDRNRTLVENKASSIRDAFGITVEADWYLGDFYESLLASIEKYGADLVVMGMAQKSVEQDLLGNTTTSAIHKLKLPILAIPLGVKFQGIKQILFACDLFRGVHRNVLKQLKEIISDFDAQVEVFHVSNKIKQLKEEADGKSTYDNVVFDQELEGLSYYFKEVQSGAVIEEIRREIKETNADLLVMVPQKYGFWSSLVHKSKTRMMASHSSVPLLSIPLTK